MTPWQPISRKLTHGSSMIATVKLEVAVTRMSILSTKNNRLFDQKFYVEYL